MNKNMKEKAITLIALTITIVVLIILAGVAINLSLGENGLLKKAKTASEEYTNDQRQEEMELAKATNEIDEIINMRGEYDDLSKSLEVLTNRVGELEEKIANDNKVYKKGFTIAEQSNISTSKTITTMDVELGNYVVIAVFRADTISGRQFFNVTGRLQNYPINSNGETGTAIGYASQVSSISFDYVRESGYFNNLYGTLIAVKVD